MKFVHEKIGRIFEWNTPYIQTLVIEHQDLFRTFLQDLSLSMDGVDTPATLSLDNKPIDIGKHMEILSDFIRFEMNRKPLINKICMALERVSGEGEHFAETQELLAKIETLIENWAFGFPCDIVASKISVSTLLKAVGIEVRDDYAGGEEEAERVIDYMELVREFDREKVFVTVNMRSYFSDDVIERFMKTVLSHEYKVLMLEAFEHTMLPLEKRWTIDRDLCEF